MLFILFLAIFHFEFGATFNDFPSLMIANATIAIVIDRPFFEAKAGKKRPTTRDAYGKKIEIFVRSVTEAAKDRTTDKNFGLEMNVFQETNVNLARDYSVLFSVANCDETWKLFDSARKQKLVHLAITDRDCPRLPIADGISVPIVEPGKELAQMLLDLRIDGILTWKKMNLFHDRVFERDTIGKVLRALLDEIPEKQDLGLSSQRLVSTKFPNVSSNKNVIFQTLKNFSSLQNSDDRFLVIVNREIVPVIIESARSLGLLHPESQWLFILPDSMEDPSNVTDLKKCLAEGENIAFIYNVTNFDDDCRIGIECHAKEMIGSLAVAFQDALRREMELFEKITEEEFDSLRMTKAERLHRIVTFIRNDLYKVKEDEERIEKCGDCIKWKMVAGVTWGNSFNRHNDTDPYELIDAGYWTPGPGSVPKDFLFPHAKYGFGGKILPIVTFHNPPWQSVESSKETGKIKWDGLVFDIVDELSKKLNFTPEFVELETRAFEEKKKIREFGKSTNNSATKIQKDEFVKASTSSGKKIPEVVIKFVQSGRAFMAACASTVDERLRSAINFTVPISVQTYSLLASRPKPLSRAMLFASPYTTESWACLAGGVLFLGPILYLVHKYSPSNSNNFERISIGLATPARCLWYIYGALLQQGGMHLPENDGARLIIGTWWLVVMVIVATYSGSLVAFLTFPRMDESINSVEDLFKNKDKLTWSLPDKSFLLDYLTNGKNGPYDDLLGSDERLAQRHDSNNYPTLVNRVKEGTHVLVDWTSSLKMLTRIDNPLNNDSVCHFSIGTETFIEEAIALILPSESPYLNLINTELKRMKEAGLIGKWTSDRMPMRDECWEGSGINNEVNNHKVDIWDMQGIFFVLFFGYLVALVFLGWEFISHYYKVAKERKIIRPFLT